MSCGKECFHNRSEAARAMGRVLSRKGAKPTGRPSVYRCDWCEGGVFHWGHEPQVERRGVLTAAGRRARFGR